MRWAENSQNHTWAVQVGTGVVVSLLAWMSLHVVILTPVRRALPLKQLVRAVVAPGLFATALYGFDRVVFIDSIADGVNHPDRAAFAAQHARAGLVIFSAVLSMAITMVIKSPVQCKWRHIVLAVLLVSSYSRGIRLKQIPFMKNFLVGGAYAQGQVMLPCGMAASEGQVSQGRLRLTAAATFFVGFAGSLMSDVRDMAGDTAQGTITVPVLFGSRAATCLATHAFALAALSLGCAIVCCLKETRKSPANALDSSL